MRKKKKKTKTPVSTGSPEVCGVDFAEHRGGGVVGSATHRVTEPRRGSAQHLLLLGMLSGVKSRARANPASSSYSHALCPSSFAFSPRGGLSRDNQLLPSPRCRLESDAERLGLAPVTPVGTWGSRAAGAEGASRTLESPALVPAANLGGCCRVFLVSPSIHLPHVRGGGTSGSHWGRLEGKGEEGDQNLHLGIGLWCGCSWGSDPAA